jgi:hypothetical protein
MIKSLKIYSSIFCLLLISIVEINAQAPGLIGKRLTIGYYANFSFNIFGSPYNAAEKSENSFGNIIHTKHNFNADYVLTRSLSLGMDYSYSRSGLLTESFLDISHNIQMREVGIRLKNFKRKTGGIAPIGFYNQYRLFRLDYETEITQASRTADPISVIDRTAYGFSLAYGHQGILVSNILYNIGFEAGGAFSSFEYREPESDALFQAKSHVSWNTFLKFKLGIVVPIF